AIPLSSCIYDITVELRIIGLCHINCIPLSPRTSISSIHSIHYFTRPSLLTCEQKNFLDPLTEALNNTMMMCNRRRSVDYLITLTVSLFFLDNASAFSSSRHNRFFISPTQPKAARRKLNFSRHDFFHHDEKIYGKFHGLQFQKSFFFTSSGSPQGYTRSPSTPISWTSRASPPSLYADAIWLQRRGICKAAHQGVFTPKSLPSLTQSPWSLQPSLANSATKSLYKSWSALVLSTQSSSNELTSQSTSSMNPMSSDGAKKIHPKLECTPVLRKLYDIPPKLIDFNITGITNANDNCDDEKYVTNVTVGSLPTADGSGHVLHYEVHRRIPQKMLKNDKTQGNEAKSTINDRTSKKGLTALFLHGGPGSGCFPNHVRFFSPRLYEYVVLLDQRGCGQSNPLGQVKGQGLDLLVDDIERLRIHLRDEGLLPGKVVNATEGRAFSDIPKGAQPWDLILGGSWGCTLAMAYAHRYPTNVRAMVLRGVCLFRPREIDWLFGDPTECNDSTGAPFVLCNMASKIFPDRWAEFRKGSGVDENSKLSRPQLSSPSLRSLITEPSSNAVNRLTYKKNPIPNNRRTVLQGYYHQLLGPDPLVRARAAQSWFRWEMGIYSSGFEHDNTPKNYSDAANSCSDGDRNDSDEFQTRLVTWNPITQAWSYEDARVWSNESLVSIDVNEDESNESNAESIVNESEVQRLRRYSFGLLSGKYVEDERTRLSTLDSRNQEPIQIDATYKPSSKPIHDQTAMANEKNQIFDPSSFIPAQSMLTCYYSLNDEYVVRPFNSFLSLAPPPGISFDSWYSSSLPPSPLRLLHSDDALSTKTEFQNYYPLPPCIAIQGGNDAICPPDTAIDLHQSWPQLELRIALKSGHSMYDPIIAGEIVKAVDRFGIHLILKDER
ncbi:hypothetical protein ACHAXS_003656, partial [Conticribra weissflogii]